MRASPGRLRAGGGEIRLPEPSFLLVSLSTSACLGVVIRESDVGGKRGPPVIRAAALRRLLRQVGALWQHRVEFGKLSEEMIVTINAEAFRFVLSAFGSVLQFSMCPIFVLARRDCNVEDAEGRENASEYGEM